MNKLQVIQNKLMPLSQLQKLLQIWRMKGDTIVFTNGVFDVMHIGHITYLAQAAALGNRLIIGLNTDESVKRLKGESRPINNQENRAILLAALGVVDAVILFDEDTPLNLITAVMPNVLVKGGDYTVETIVGAAQVQAAGGIVEVLPFVEGYSTTAILNKIIALG